MSVYNHRSYLRSPFLLPPLPVGFRGFPPNATRLTTLVLLCPAERVVLCRRCCVNLRSSSAEAPSARPNIGTSLSTVNSLANPRFIGQSEYTVILHRSVRWGCHAASAAPPPRQGAVAERAAMGGKSENLPARYPLPLATAHVPLLRGVSQSRRGSVAPRRTKPRNPLRLHRRFFGIIFSSREAHCAARGHSPENGTVGAPLRGDRINPAGRLINVASTLHVVPAKYGQIF